LNTVTNKYIKMPLNVEELINNYMNYKLYNCDDKLCKETTGYIKFENNDGTVNYISISLSPSINNIISENDITGLSSNELCIINDINVNNIESKELNTYILNVSSTDNSIFNNYSSKNIIIETYNNIIYYDNPYYDVGINIFNKNKKIEIEDISKDNCENLSIYYCKNDGTCQKLEGRVKNGDYYYYIKDNGTSYRIKDSSFETEESFVINCDIDNYGKILENSHELCISNDKSISFVSNNEINYYIIAENENNFKFVRAVKDVFGLNPINGKYEYIIIF